MVFIDFFISKVQLYYEDTYKARYVMISVVVWDGAIIVYAIVIIERNLNWMGWVNRMWGESRWDNISKSSIFERKQILTLVILVLTTKTMRDRKQKKPNNRSYRCDLCEFGATHIPWLMSHLIKMYVQEIPQKCEQCMNIWQ